MTVTGDDSQVDLPAGRTSGLAHALRVLAPIPDVSIVRFGVEDVVRHPLVGRIIDAYAADEVERQRRQAARRAGIEGG